MLLGFHELLNNVLDRAEEESGTQITASEYVGLATEYLDRVYQDVLNRRAWMWLRARTPFIIQMAPKIETTITWAQGSIVATFGDTPPRPLDGYKVCVNNDKTRSYRCIQFAGSTALLMETAWPFEPLVSAPAMFYRDEYPMHEVPGDPPAPSLVVEGDGDINPGYHAYAITWVAAAGETSRSLLGSVDLGTPSRVRVILPAPTDTFRCLGWNIYRTAVTPPPWDPMKSFLFRVGHVRVEPRALYDAEFIDNVPDSHLETASAPIAPMIEGPNGTCNVRHIIAARAKGHHRSIRDRMEGYFREDWPQVPKETWPPQEYSRVLPERLIFSSIPPDRVEMVEVFHTQAGLPLSRCTPNEILVPGQYRWTLADGALGLLLEQKHSDRSKHWLGAMEAQLNVMTADDEKVKKGYDDLRYGRRMEVIR